MDPGYDFIGDVHGYASKLTALLTRLGYKTNGKGYTHPHRKVFFLGDYLNRGPEIPRTLEIVRTMIDNGDALGIMGNHEYYAVCFNTPKKSGGYLRRHSIKNILNQYETFRQFRNDEKLYQSYLEWFLTLPLFYEDAGVRGVHACWDFPSIEILKKRLDGGQLTPAALEESRDESSEFCAAVHTVLKGKEILLPATSQASEPDQERLTKIRTKWWEDPVGKTYRALAIQPDPRWPDMVVPAYDLPGLRYYSTQERPVFFGHYGLTEKPALLRQNICCLDFGVAKGGELAAYRFGGETDLSAQKLEWVPDD